MQIVNYKSKLMIGLLVLALIISMCSFTVFAGDLNGIGSSNNDDNTETSSSNETAQATQDTGTKPTNNDIGGLPESTNKDKILENGAAIGDMMGNVGPDAEDLKEAQEFIKPLANIMNKVMAVILGITLLLMMFITVLDLLYIAFPPIRDILDGGRKGAANNMGGVGGRAGAGMRGSRYGMMNGMAGGMSPYGGGMAGGMAGGMSPYSGGMQGQQQQASQLGGGLSAVGRWVSDEAISACLEAQGGGLQGMPGAGGVGVKSIVVSYMKKRSMFLILFGVCFVLFTSTVFTDLGVRLGTWILNIITGF